MLYQLSYLGAEAPSARRTAVYREAPRLVQRVSQGVSSRRGPCPASGGLPARAWKIAPPVVVSSAENEHVSFRRLRGALALATPCFAEDLPKHVGDCATTKVQKVETRLVDGSGQPVKGSGSAVDFANGGYQVSYDTVPESRGLAPRRRGENLPRLDPSPCPPGDKRGRVYKTTNLRTKGSWTLPDSEHSCGGA